MVAPDQLVAAFSARQLMMAGLSAHALKQTSLATCQPDADT